MRKNQKTFCNAKLRDGRRCQQTAGWGTNHTGVGRCKFHGGLGRNVKDKEKQRQEAIARGETLPMGDYSKHLERTTLKELVERFHARVNPTDLLDELALARAVLVTEINRTERLHQDLLAWNRWFDEPVSEKYASLSADITATITKLKEAKEVGDSVLHDQHLDEFKQLHEKLIGLLDVPERPSEVPDFGRIVPLIQRVGTLAERIHHIQGDGAISGDELLAALQRVGALAVHSARDTIRDERERSAFLDAFREAIRNTDLLQGE